MASLCKRQQCTVERRGFRQELDSWRHKLIHCVGFESILEGLFGPGLVKDITLFQGKQAHTHTHTHTYTHTHTHTHTHQLTYTFLNDNCTFRNLQILKQNNKMLPNS
uniref:Uncharacterized protein n=1 Tax=Sparus aurata TaxID=8175 RepID=A0A671WTY1_SPAAU